MTRGQKYRDVARFLRSKGWSKVRQRGSHEIWQPADGAGVVSVGIVRQIQKVWSDTPPTWS